MPECGGRQWSRRSFLRGSVPKSQRKAMGDARNTDAISLEELPKVKVRISHSHCAQQVLGAKDTIPSQAPFCNAEGSENRKETSGRGVGEATHATGNSARTSRQDLVRPVLSLPTSLRPFTPSPFSSSLLHLEYNLISSSPTFSYSLHSTPCDAKIPKRRNRDVDKYRKAKGGGETANSGGRTSSETSVAGWRGVKLQLAFRVRSCTWRALASNVVASVLACN